MWGATGERQRGWPVGRQQQLRQARRAGDLVQGLEKMSEPTKHQKEADQFDATLFKLLWHAISYSADGTRSKAERHAWDVIRIRLSEARPFVRSQMHPDRVKETDTIQPQKPKVQRVCCPSCETTFDVNNVKRPRSVDQHRRFWKLITLSFSNWPETHEMQFTSVNDLRLYLTMAAGWREVAATIPLTGVKPEVAVIVATAAMKAAGAHATAATGKGNLYIWVPKSIAFHKMGSQEFGLLNDAVSDVIARELGITADELLEQAKGNV
jgi:hypothetical protein